MPCRSVIYRVLRYALAAVLLAVVSGRAVLPVSLADELSSDELPLTILHTNDEHSSIIPHSPAVDHDPANPDDPTIGGFARLATAIADIRAQKAQEEEPVLLIGAGDFLGGTAFGWLAPEGHGAELRLMQAMGYDAVTIGNHEYDYGPEVLADYLLGAGYPEAHEQTALLASNTRPPADHPLAEQNLLRDMALLTLDNGIRVGLFALLGEDAETVTADTGQIVFLDRLETAREMIAALQSERAEIIVAITHSGVDEDIDLARNVPGIDLIVGGHSHTPLYEPVMEGDTLIVQAGGLGRYLGRLDLAYSPATGALRVRNQDFLIPIDGRIAPEPEIARLVDTYTDRLNDLVGYMTGGRIESVLDPIARSDFDLSNEPPLQESPAGNFAADAMRLVTQEVMGKRVDVAVQANGTIRGSIVRGTGPHTAGDISFYDLATVMGLGYGPDGYAGYPVISAYLTGEEVRRMLEVSVLLAEMLGDTFFLQYSGLRYSYNPENAILLTIPFMDQPLPTGRAVTRAELYTGESYQPHGDDSEYIPMERGDDALYHLVTDRYILSFLPMVGEMLPHLEIVPKNADGEAVPLDEFDDLIIHHPDGRELKAWYTMAEYAMAQPRGEDGAPRIPAYYASTAGRINPTGSFPLIAAVYAVPVVLGGGIAGLFWQKRRRNPPHSSRS